MKSSWMVCLLLCLACDDGQGGGGSSRLPKSKSLAELSVAQNRTFCRWLTQYEFDHYSIDDGCTEEAVFETTTLAECKEYVATCVDEDKEELPAELAEFLRDCEEVQEVSPECTASVAEYETCYRAEIDAYARAAREYSCLDAGEEGLEDDEETWVSEECEEIFDACDDSLFPY
jgi:hypothetical protein